jgi:hypothetical protein
MRKEHAERDGVTYKLETRKMMSGLPRESFSIMILPLGHKMDLGWGFCTLFYVLHLIIWLQVVVEIITSGTTRALDITGQAAHKST